MVVFYDKTAVMHMIKRWFFDMRQKNVIISYNAYFFNETKNQCFITTVDESGGCDKTLIFVIVKKIDKTAVYKKQPF